MIDFSAYVKYSRPGPRYTSYPTAPEFSDKFSYEAYIKELENRDKKKAAFRFICTCHFAGVLAIFVAVTSSTLAKRTAKRDI